MIAQNAVYEASPKPCQALRRVSPIFGPSSSIVLSSVRVLTGYHKVYPHYTLTTS